MLTIPGLNDPLAPTLRNSSILEECLFFKQRQGHDNKTLWIYQPLSWANTIHQAVDTTENKAVYGLSDEVKLMVG